MIFLSSTSSPAIFVFAALRPRRCKERIKHTQNRSVHGRFTSTAIRHTRRRGFQALIPASFWTYFPQRFREAGRQTGFAETAHPTEVTTLQSLRYKEVYRLSRERVA
jgi:hypothetical protein